jgi:mRNA-degrading endonuclease RelE of RelBE toxin-antitoxin system
VNYSVRVLRRAQKEISRLSGDAYEQVRSSILLWATIPGPPATASSQDGTAGA